jgi:hypothetical protein
MRRVRGRGQRKEKSSQKEMSSDTGQETESSGEEEENEEDGCAENGPGRAEEEEPGSIRGGRGESIVMCIEMGNEPSSD